MPDSTRTIIALWATSDRYPPQFVGAVSEGLREAWHEESERIRELAEKWFAEFDEDGGPWTFHSIVHLIDVPREL
jgi:hypothetical protein